MAQSERRSLLSTYDINAAAPITSGFGMSAPHKLNKGAIPPSSRQSMIPRQSMLPGRLPTNAVAPSGQENLLNASARKMGGSRSSMAAGLGYTGASGSAGMDIDMAGPSSASTPHRGQVGPTRRGESAGRMSMASTPNNRKSLGGRQSLAPRTGVNLKAMQPVDPRPIREDRQLLMRMETDIQGFLEDTAFVFPAKYSGEFHMPSQVLAMSAFRHIYHQCIDLTYVFAAEPKKEVEEVMQLMNDVKYPLIGDLSKTKLSAPGSIHNWPPVCGMLHWMICIKSSLDLPTTKYHGGPLERPVSSEDEDFCHYFPYLWHCYEQFWESKDEYPEERAKLEAIFEEKAKQASQEVRNLREEELRLASRLQHLEETKSPLSVAENEKRALEESIRQYEEYKRHTWQPKMDKLQTSDESLQGESARYEDRIGRLLSYRDTLQEQVDAQNLTADDFDQLIRQRELLAEQLRQVMTRLQEQSMANSHDEISLSNKQSRVEDELKELTNLCREIGLLPFALPDGTQLYDFDIVAGNSDTMLPRGLDLKGDIQRKIAGKRESLAMKHRVTTKERSKLEEEHNMVLEDVHEKLNEIGEVETRLRSTKEQTDMANNVNKEESSLQAEAEANSEMALAQLDHAGRSALDQAEARLQTAKMQINLVRDQDERLREELHQKYVAGLETILSLKSLVSEGFKALEEATLNHAK